LTALEHNKRKKEEESSIIQKKTADEPKTNWFEKKEKGSARVTRW